LFSGSYTLRIGNTLITIPMKRKYVYAILILSVFVSGVALLLRHPAVYTLLPTSLQSKTGSVAAVRYTASSTVPGYSITLVDTQFFDYISGKTGIFETNGVMDPQYYRQGGSPPRRLTVSHVRFELVPTIDNFLLALDGKDNFSGRGDYIVQDDVLVIRVSVDYEEKKTFFTKKFSAEDAFLHTAFQTLYYAHGLSEDGLVNAKNFSAINEEMNSYLYGGIMPWPIRIEQ